MHTLRVLLCFGSGWYYYYPSGELQWHNAREATLKKMGNDSHESTSEQKNEQGCVHILLAN